jgi:predicted PurR-regulated permease PerM
VTGDNQTDIAGLLASTPLRLRSAAVVLLAVLAILYTAYIAADVIVPIVGAFLLNFLLSPMASALVRFGIPRVAAAALILIALIAGVSGIFYGLSDPAADWLRKLPTNIEELKASLAYSPDPLADVREASEAVEEAMQDLTGKPVAAQVQIQEPPLLTAAMNRVPTIAAGIMLSIFLTFLLMISADSFLRKMTSLGRTFGARRRIVMIMRQLELQLAYYLGTITLINSGLGITVAGAMYFLGLPNPALWGAVAAILNFAPYLGPAVTTGVLLLAGIDAFETLAAALLPPAAYLVLTMLEGQVVTPLLVGRRMDLSPVVVFISVVVFGWIWGMVGALLAVPMVASIKICLINLPRTRVIGKLLGT